MRSIELTGPDGKLKDDAFCLMLAHCFFPESEADREQALCLARMETERLKAVGREAYEVSEIAKSAIRIVDRRQGHLTLVGYVAIAMCCLDNAGEPMTIQGAAKVVSELAYELGTFEIEEFKDGKFVPRTMRANGDLADIKKLFRRYQSVAHICAARVTAAEYLEAIPFLERAPDAEACLIQTAAFFQMRLTKAKGYPDWDVWDLIRTRPVEIQEHPALMPSETHLHQLFTPYVQSRQGPPGSET